MDRRKSLAILAGALAPACSNRRELTVASKNFTEQLVLGEIIAQHLERRLGEPVKRTLNLGGTLLAHEALVHGQIDLYPEYTGTALTSILKLAPPSDPAAAFEKVRDEYGRRYRLRWGNPLGFNNTFAMVIRGQDAREFHLESLSDASAMKRPWRLGAGYEFQQRPDGLEGLQRTYHLPLAGSVSTMDLGLLYQALRQGHVDMVAGNSTDGLLSVLDVTVLADNKRYFPPYDAAIIVREESLRAHPKLGPALQEFEGRFSEKTMRRLNYALDGEHQSLEEVAKEFLSTVG